MEADWIEDGHKVVINWDGDTISIKRVDCPFDDGGAVCNRRKDFCVVSRFLGVYGPELNIGTADVDGLMEIAWVGIPGDSDLDDELAAIWVIPVNDANFQEMRQSRESLPE